MDINDTAGINNGTAEIKDISAIKVIADIKDIVNIKDTKDIME